MKRIAILFSVALILSVPITMALNHKFMMKNAAIQAGETAEVAAAGARAYLEDMADYDDLMKDARLRKEAHDAFRFICSETGIRYMYLYKIDEEEIKHLIVCAAGDEEDDLRLSRDFAFGSEARRPVYESERKVMSGEVYEAFEFIDDEYGNVCQYVVPAFDDEERNILIGVDYSVDRITDIARKNVMMLIFQGAIMIGLAFVIAMLLVSSLVIKPIKLLSGRMNNFVNDRNSRVPYVKAEHRFEDEISDMEDSFDKMAVDISDYVDNIERLSDEKAEVRTQMDIARKIQCGIIPSESVLKGNGYEISGVEKPAREVGGDFYDIFYLDKENVCVVAGDVSGKGIVAALVMLMVRTAIQEKVRAGVSLSDTLNRINQELYLKNPENMFITAFLMSMNIRTGEVRYANAGHNPPVLLTDSPSYLKVNPGIAMGVFDDSRIIEEEIKLGPGEGILIYTDGITEAVNTGRAQYGEERLRTAILTSCRENGGYDARRLVSDVVASVDGFSKDAEQFDDMTCCAVIHKGYVEQDRPDLESFGTVKDTLISSFGNNEKTRSWILACEEIHTNIVDYSGADHVSFRFERRGDNCSVTFIDNGVYFNPKKATVRTKEFEELDSGGMGILFARKIAKEMVYDRVADTNVLTLRFEG